MKIYGCNREHPTDGECVPSELQHEPWQGDERELIAHERDRHGAPEQAELPDSQRLEQRHLQSQAEVLGFNGMRWVWALCGAET